MIAPHNRSLFAAASLMTAFIAMGLVGPATAADKLPNIVIKPAHSAGKVAQPARSAKHEPDQIVCVAGCDSFSPIVVQERPHVPYAAPARPQWVEQTWDVHCADGLGCRARNVLPMPRRCCDSSTTIMIFRDYYWR